MIRVISSLRPRGPSLRPRGPTHILSSPIVSSHLVSSRIISSLLLSSLLFSSFFLKFFFKIEWVRSPHYFKYNDTATLRRPVPKPPGPRSILPRLNTSRTPPNWRTELAQSVVNPRSNDQSQGMRCAWCVGCSIIHSAVGSQLRTTHRAA